MRVPPAIPAQYLPNLKKYAYSGVDKSLFSRYILNPYWNKLVTFFPSTIAPNTITFSGLLIVLCNVLTLLYYDAGVTCACTTKPDTLGCDGSDRGRCPPPWVYFSWALGLFVYQSLDAIDGKQARRTGMAGPLGELFDHGCDALNTTLEVILSTSALNVGHSWWAVASQTATLANFYLSTWEEYHTGTLYLSHFSGPVEGILMIVVIYIITGLFGPQFWDRGILSVLRLSHLFPSLPNPALNDTFLTFGALGLLANVLTAYSNVLSARRRKHLPLLTPLLGLLPFFLSTALHVAWLAGARAQVLRSPTLFVPFLLYWGLGFAHHVGYMILGHVAKMPFPYAGTVGTVWTALGAVDANLGRIGMRPLIQSTPYRTSLFVFISLVFAFIVYARFCVSVIGSITEYLGIGCFRVRKRTAAGTWGKPEDAQVVPPSVGTGAAAAAVAAGGNGTANGFALSNGNGEAVKPEAEKAVLGAGWKGKRA